MDTLEHWVLMGSDKRHPVKLVTEFIKKIKHLITDDGYPITQLNRFFTIVAHLHRKEWELVKDNEEQKLNYIKKMEDAEKELEDEGSLKKKEKPEEESEKQEK